MDTNHINICVRKKLNSLGLLRAYKRVLVKYLAVLDKICWNLELKGRLEAVVLRYFLDNAVVETDPFALASNDNKVYLPGLNGSVLRVRGCDNVVGFARSPDGACCWL